MKTVMLKKGNHRLRYDTDGLTLNVHTWPEFYNRIEVRKNAVVR